MALPILISNRDDSSLLLDASGTDASIVVGPDRLAQVSELSVYVAFNDTAVGGSVIIESAHNPHYTGEWHQLAKVDWVKSGKVHAVSIPGVHLYLRVRVAKPITSGTVSVYAIAN